jgi:KUP system potassium uptake protein
VSQSPESPTARNTVALSLGALGIVFGDLGTSPLYALQEAFHPEHGVTASADNVIGCASLFMWSLILMVSLKYVWVLMRADNQGEGGILALLALTVGTDKPNTAKGAGQTVPGAAWWVVLALIGTAMLYGDGVITPAISVLSAVEGLSVATPAFTPYVVPLTVAILVGLFCVQSKGSGRVGVAFGPILTLWFVAILILGLASLVQTPEVLAAFNPVAGIAFFHRNGFQGFVALGAVVLCLTGGEALYADMGHFGRKPIQVAWYALALPALMVNYLGQAALLLREPALADHPFYAMVPGWALYPMVALATLATIVAAQALITAVFSLTNQAMQLGLFPRVRVVHTSADTRGQIYLPGLNWILMLATVAVVVGFRSSSSLAAAFGLAVSVTMAITTVLFAALAYLRLQWSSWRIAWVVSVFLVIDLAFVGANALKFMDGGWLPLLMGASTFTTMLAWRYGRQQLSQARHGTGLSVAELVEGLRHAPPHRVHGIAVFLTERSHEVPTVLLHHLKHNQVLHEKVVLLTLQTTNTPRVPTENRVNFVELGLGFTSVVANYGFMEQPNVPDVLAQASYICGKQLFEAMSTTYYMGHETLVLGTDWRAAGVLMRIFTWLRRNELDATAHFGMPANRVVEMGSRLEVRTAKPPRP